jgi:hypothetical protein
LDFYNHMNKKENRKGILLEILEFEYLEIFEKSIVFLSSRNYFWTIHEQRLMLVANVSTYYVTWDNSKAGPRELEYCDILVRMGSGILGQVL